MNDHITRQTQEFYAAAKDARIPENVQAIAEEGIAKTREAYEKINTVTKDGVKAFEDVVEAANAGAKTIGEKVLRNTEVNAEAAFDAAQAIARAKTLPEAIRLQTTFAQQQFAVAGAQTKELFELTAQVAQQTVETVNTAATKAFDQIKKAG